MHRAATIYNAGVDAPNVSTARRRYAERLVAALRPARNLAGVAAVTQAAGAEVDQIVTILEQRARDEAGATLACRAGCHYCCTMRVTASVAEVVALADHLRRTWSSQDLEALRRSIEAYDRDVRENDPHLMSIYPRLCPLNAEGLCRVYAHRPLACRSFQSLDAEACRRRFIEREMVPVPQVTAIPAMSGTVASGLQDAAEYVRAGPRVVHFAPALGEALKPGRIKDWQQGLDVFGPYYLVSLPDHVGGR